MPEVEAISDKIIEALAMAGPMETQDITAVLCAAGIQVTTGQVHALLTTMAVGGRVMASTERRESFIRVKWAIGSPPVLTWEKPPRAEPYAEWAKYQADGAPPGTWVPNMSDEWKLRWKAKMAGQRSDDLRTEVRKTTAGLHGDHVQVLMVVRPDSVRMSMNGTAEFSEREWAELPRAVDEARKAMRTWRDGQLARNIQLPGPSRETIEDLR